MKTKEVKPKRPPRTPKERKFVKEYLTNGGNKVQAAMAAYDTKSINSATRIAYENTQKLTFDDYFEKAGLTDEAIAPNLRDAAFAEKTDTADWNIRLKAHELAVKLMNKMPKEQGDTTNNIVIAPIMGGTSHEVLSDDRNEEVVSTTQTDSSDSGGDLGEQDDIDTLIPN